MNSIALIVVAACALTGLGLFVFLNLDQIDEQMRVNRIKSTFEQACMTASPKDVCDMLWRQTMAGR